MSDEPPLLIRVWLCFSAPRRWARRIILVQAAKILFYSGINERIGWELRFIVNKMWDKEFKRFKNK